MSDHEIAYYLNKISKEKCMNIDVLNVERTHKLPIELLTAVFKILN